MNASEKADRKQQFSKWLESQEDDYASPWSHAKRAKVQSKNNDEINSNESVKKTTMPLPSSTIPTDFLASNIVLEVLRTRQLHLQN
jgi:hypothetical protein